MSSTNLTDMSPTVANFNRRLTSIADEHTIPINLLCQRLGTSITRGLTESQVKCMLKERGGKNLFKTPKRKVLFGLAERLYGSSKDEKFTKSEWDRLVAQRIPRQVTVIREGQRKTVLGKNIVVGDLVVLDQMDVVPADIRLIASKNVVVDNSLITGITQEFRTHDVSLANEDCLLSPNMIFSCTRIIHGKCIGVVLRTGEGTVFGTLKNFATKVKFEKVQL